MLASRVMNAPPLSILVTGGAGFIGSAVVRRLISDTVHVCTDEVFGSPGPDGRFDATSRYDPSSPYSASKAAAAHLVRAWRRTYGLPTPVTGSSNSYGPWQPPEKLIPEERMGRLV